jgi:hypothetical protein
MAILLKAMTDSSCSHHGIHNSILIGTFEQTLYCLFERQCRRSVGDWCRPGNILIFTLKLHIKQMEVRLALDAKAATGATFAFLQ